MARSPEASGRRSHLINVAVIYEVDLKGLILYLYLILRILILNLHLYLHLSSPTYQPALIPFPPVPVLILGAAAV